MTRLKIITPDDWHVHFRDGEILKKLFQKLVNHLTEL